MKGLKTYGQWLKESLNEGNVSSDLFIEMYEDLKKINRTGISVPPSYQTFDRDMFFEFEANGMNYRLSFESSDGTHTLTNMDDGTETLITSTDELLSKIS